MMKRIECRSGRDNGQNLSDWQILFTSVWFWSRTLKPTVEAHCGGYVGNGDATHNVVECSNASEANRQYAWCLDCAVLLPKPYVQTTQCGQQTSADGVCAWCVHAFCQNIIAGVRRAMVWVSMRAAQIDGNVQWRPHYQRQQNQQKIEVLFRLY